MRRFLACILVLAASLAADDKTPAVTKSLQVNPQDLIRAFEPPANEPYTLGEGDEILVEVNGRSELTGSHVIGPDGSVTLPLAGPVIVTGLTREKAAEMMTEKLSKYYTSLACVVRVTKYGSNKILLLGRVEHPGLIYFDSTPTLLEVLSKGGGVAKPGANDNPIPVRCAIFRGADQVVWLNVKEMLESGNRLADMRLRRNDVVFVPSVQDSMVSVLGEVMRPGVVPLREGATLSSVLAEAGGLNDKASANHIRLVNSATGMTREVTLDEILDVKKSSEIQLHAGDLIYVSKSRLAKVSLVFEKLGPAGSLMMFGAFIAR